MKSYSTNIMVRISFKIKGDQLHFTCFFTCGRRINIYLLPAFLLYAACAIAEIGCLIYVISKDPLEYRRIGWPFRMVCADLALNVFPVVMLPLGVLCWRFDLFFCKVLYIAASLGINNCAILVFRILLYVHSRDSAIVKALLGMFVARFVAVLPVIAYTIYYLLHVTFVAFANRFRSAYLVPYNVLFEIDASPLNHGTSCCFCGKPSNLLRSHLKKFHDPCLRSFLTHTSLPQLIVFFGLYKFDCYPDMLTIFLATIDARIVLINTNHFKCLKLRKVMHWPETFLLVSPEGALQIVKPSLRQTATVYSGTTLLEEFSVFRDKHVPDSSSVIVCGTLYYIVSRRDISTDVLEKFDPKRNRGVQMCSVKGGATLMMPTLLYVVDNQYMLLVQVQKDSHETLYILDLLDEEAKTMMVMLDQAVIRSSSDVHFRWFCSGVIIVNERFVLDLPRMHIRRRMPGEYMESHIDTP